MPPALYSPAVTVCWAVQLILAPTAIVAELQTGELSVLLSDKVTLVRATFPVFVIMY